MNEPVNELTLFGPGRGVLIGILLVEGLVGLAQGGGPGVDLEDALNLLLAIPSSE